MAHRFGSDGILVVDKPIDVSSAGVVATVKAALGARKVGHAGTLDPFATGVLVCCVNRATRLARFLLKGRKTYRARLRLGIETDTQDVTGTVTARAATDSLDAHRIQTVLKEFIGSQEQLPPVYSALKHDGVALYKLARRGTPVQKPPRRIEIERIDVRTIELPEVEFDVICSAGTYIRTLCADMGRRLGCGGHLATLRRLESSGFSIDEAVQIEALPELVRSGGIAQRLVSMARSLRGIPEWVAGPDLAEKVVHGQPLGETDAAGQKLPEAGIVKLVDSDDRLLAVVRRTRDGLFQYEGVFGERI